LGKRKTWWQRLKERETERTTLWVDQGEELNSKEHDQWREGGVWVSLTEDALL
jgi:hypothetical protein